MDQIGPQAPRTAKRRTHPVPTEKAHAEGGGDDPIQALWLSCLVAVELAAEANSFDEAGTSDEGGELSFPTLGGTNVKIGLLSK